MKAKYTLLAVLASAMISCDDSTSGLGLDMFPNSDQSINGKLSVFNVTTNSILAGDIYAKTNIGYVGQFTDQEFGTYKAGFLASINCPDGLTFPGVYTDNAKNEKGELTNIVVGESANQSDLKDITLIRDENGKVIGNIHTVELYLWYNTFFGDSVSANRLSVYELKNKLNEKDAYYTSINPDEYYDEQDPTALLGSKIYTGVDYSIKDSIRNLSSYTPYVHLNFDKDIAVRVGSKILKAAKKAGPKFNYEKFSDVFKGIYVKNDFGDGTVLYIIQAEMNVVYKCYAIDAVTGKKLRKSNNRADSTYFTSRTFNSTREVIQANHMSNNEERIKELIKENNNTYLKSPAGIFTQAEIPVSEVYEKLQQDTLNAVKLTFSGYNNQVTDNKYVMDIPSTVMLIRKKYKDSFFVKNELANNKTSYLSTFNSSTYQYTFSNITNLINDCLNDGEREKAIKELPMNITVTNAEGNQETHYVETIEEWEKYSDWNKVILIPVLVSYDNASSQNRQIISIQHDLKPSYIRLKGGFKGYELPEYQLKLEVVSTSIGQN